LEYNSAVTPAPVAALAAAMTAKVALDIMQRSEVDLANG
jgi:hypothetical protein